jgi:hypothetical protein
VMPFLPPTEDSGYDSFPGYKLKLLIIISRYIQPPYYTSYCISLEANIARDRESATSMRKREYIFIKKSLCGENIRLLLQLKILNLVVFSGRASIFSVTFG